jgi:hypothetical protein
LVQEGRTQTLVRARSHNSPLEGGGPDGSTSHHRA